MALPFIHSGIVLLFTLLAIFGGFVGFKRIFVMIKTGAEVDYSDRLRRGEVRGERAHGRVLEQQRPRSRCARR